MAVQLTVRAHQITTLLDAIDERTLAGIEVLSLDCFDTLIWRATHAPADVFAAIDLPGGAMGPRQWSEGAARRIVANRTGASEIRLADVYRHLLPNADDAAIERAVAAELAHEAHHAFAFSPTVRLMREAKRRGLSVIVVSDMYLSEAQLRAHIAAAAGDDVLALIDRVFVSADHGCGKRDGLFEHVLKAIKVAPGHILHVGDNRAADHDAAAAHGLNVVHLEQFDPATEARLRHEASAATLIDAAARVTRPVLQPHRAAVALRACDDPAFVLGHDVLGPAMHGFALWLKRELDEMAARLGRPVRPLFLMRDGFLPMQVFQALFPDAGAAPVELSRTVSVRASLTDDRALDEYLGEWLDRLSLAKLARQMMLFGREVAKPLALGDTPSGRRAFARAVREPQLRRRIAERAATFGDKLLAHLRTAGVERGDAVMLVDLGYNGTVQNLVTPLLEGRGGLAVAGRYLVLREGQCTGLDKRGMLDVRGYEHRTLHAVLSSIAVLEQMCNVTAGSTIDFAADGTPVREAGDAKAAQHAIRDSVQAACLAYVAGAGGGAVRPATSDDTEARVQAAAAALARLAFLPSADEVALLEAFHHDANMGSAQVEPLFDAERAAAGLRRHGLPYLDDAPCMYRPGELQRHGVPMMLSLFASARFALDLRATDFATGGVAVPVVLLGGAGGAVVEKIAYPTINGFYRLEVPVAPGQVPGVQFGRSCEWLQVEEVSYLPLPGGKAPRRAQAAATLVDGMETLAEGLFRANPAGMLVAPPPAAAEPMILAVVFRPVRWRREAAATARAA